MERTGVFRRDESARHDAPVVFDFDAPSAVADDDDDDDDAYHPPRWLADPRVARFDYAAIIVGMVIVFVLGFPPPAP